MTKTRGTQQGAALMKRTGKYAALDVHQTTTTASVREEGGRVIARAIVPTEELAIVEFFRGMRGTVRVAFEEGTQAQWLVKSRSVCKSGAELLGTSSKLPWPPPASRGGTCRSSDAEPRWS